MLKTEQRLLTKIARMYYIQDFTQQEIAKHFGLSRQKVNRMIKRAKEFGIVRISIANNDHLFTLEHEAESKLNVEEVWAVPSSSDNLPVEMGRVASEVLLRQVHSNSLIGISWGTTLANIVPWMQDRKPELKNITLIPLNGGVSRSVSPTGAGQLLEAVGFAMNASIYHLPVPAVVDSAEVSKQLYQERSVRDVMSLVKKIDIAVFSIGIPGPNSILHLSGYLSAEEFEVLIQERGAVGDICSRYFNSQGEIAWPELDERTIGISIEDLKKIPRKICVAYGKHKSSAIKTAIHSGYINTLVADTDLIETIL